MFRFDVLLIAAILVQPAVLEALEANLSPDTVVIRFLLAIPLVALGRFILVLLLNRPSVVEPQD
ncbi:hypothetical protein LWF01_19200 [Saxibacter everestensis]|uniref:Uncharacterized protein n=1 Tax=Saxibacter everestensis TaxID=2909229 RepID=A0ABY8QV01_9MICO|nr:hypothetical protein LWF01_19200 [Brevibacteriaceae bacterium ZFBP1038]